MTTITDTGTPMPDVSNYQIIKRLLRFMKPFNWAMTISLLARVIKFCGQAAVLGIAAASVGIYVENAEPGIVNWGIIWTQVGWIAVAGVIVSITSYIEMYLGHYVAFHILMAFRNRFYDAIVPLAPAKTGKLQSGEAVGRVMTDCERIEPFYAHTIAPAIAAFWVPAFILAWCWTVSPTLVYVLLPFYAANTLLLPWLVARLGGDGIKYREQLGQVNAFVSDSIQGVRDTVAFGYEKQRAKELWETGATMQEGQEKLYGADAWQRALAEVFITVGILAAAWTSIDLALAGKIDPLVDVPAVIAVSVVGFYLSVGLANNYTDFRVAIYAARRLFSMMEQEPAVYETATAPVVEKLEPSIHFEDVGFEYDTEDAAWAREKKVFDGFSIDIEKGAHVALVGPSGGGKSTICNLLLRQWDPQSGSIRIGDRPLTDFPLADLQRMFAVVQQRAYIFNDTLLENIRMGKYDATDEEIAAAVEKAGMTEWVASLPAGLQTQAGERGSSISGGQRQRLAIARAVLKNAPMVLLDEATSNLDLETERGVMEALKRLAEGRTTITIAHRLSTIIDCDTIFVLTHGKITEKGTHEELMAAGGWYARMFELQQDEVDATLAT
ncbi:MAG: ABC transporter ATP-binding protein/permease [Gammaproteobacteria bacterium]|nr:ABC transporter ATP-binding protein/permease [Gammaproteobacteria bacterium]